MKICKIFTIKTTDRTFWRFSNELWAIESAESKCLLLISFVLTLILTPLLLNPYKDSAKEASVVRKLWVSRTSISKAKNSSS